MKNIEAGLDKIIIYQYNKNREPLSRLPVSGQYKAVGNNNNNIASKLMKYAYFIGILLCEYF